MKDLEKTMISVVNRVINKKKEDAMSAYNLAILGMKEEFIDYISEAYDQAVEDFYNDYDPVVYIRNYSLLNNKDQIFQPYVDGSKISVVIDESGMTAPHAWIRVFEGGWHGGAIYRGKKRGDWHDEIDSIDGPYYWPNFQLAHRTYPSSYDRITEAGANWINNSLYINAFWNIFDNVLDN